MRPYAAVLFWLAARPAIRVGEKQFNVGERAIAWREVREVNRSRFLSPLIVKVKLTNGRKKVLVFPGEPERIERLDFQLRRHSSWRHSNGVAYRDYWTWLILSSSRAATPRTHEQPVRMLSTEEEEEIERLYPEAENRWPT